MCGLWLLYALGSAAGADCKGQNLKAVTVVPASVVRLQGSRPHYGRWCGSRNGRDGYPAGLVGSLRFEPRELHDLGPLFGFVGNEFSEIGGRAGNAVPPRSARRALNLGSVRAALISLLSLSMISAGVSFGTPTPCHQLAP